MYKLVLPQSMLNADVFPELINSSVTVVDSSGPLLASAVVDYVSSVSVISVPTQAELDQCNNVKLPLRKYFLFF